MSSGKRALRNTVLNALNIGIQITVSFVTSVIVARTLGPEKTGIYSFCLWLAAILMVPAMLGMDVPLAKYVSEYLGRGERPKAAAAARHFFKVQTLSALGLSAAFVVVIALLPSIENRRLLLFVAAIVLIGTNREVLGAILTGAQKYRVLLWMTLVSGIVQVGCVVWVAWTRRGIRALLAAVVISTIGGWLIAAVAVKRDIGSERREQLPSENRARIWSFVRSSFLIAIFYAILWQRMEISLLRVFSSAAQIAYFFIAFAFVEKLERLIVAFTSVLLPISSERYGASGIEHQARMYARAVRYLAMMVIPLSLAASIVVRPFVKLFYGAAYLAVVPIAQIGFASLMITTLAGLATSFLYAVEQEKKISWIWGLSAILNVVAAILVIPRGGALGAALAKVAVQFIATVFSLVSVQQIVRATFPWGSVLKFLLITVLAFTPAAIASAYGDWKWLVPALACGFALNVAALRWSGDFGQTETELLRSLLPGRHAAVDAPFDALNKPNPRTHISTSF